MPFLISYEKQRDNMVLSILPLESISKNTGLPEMAGTILVKKFS